MVALLQHVAAQVFGSAGTNPVRATLPNPITPGSLLVVGAVYQAHFLDMVPDAGLSSVPASGTIDCSGNSWLEGLYYRRTQAGDGQTWGWTGTGGVDREVYVAEFSGVFGADPLSGMPSNNACNASGSPPTHVSTALIPPAARSLVIAAVVGGTGENQTYSADAGYLFSDKREGIPGVNSCLLYRIVPVSAGPYSPGASYNAGSWQEILAGAFAESAGPPAFRGEPGGSTW